MTKGGKILIIDDELAIRRLLKVSLKSHDFEIIEAVNGQDGIQRAAMNRPDLIILDLGLPDMEGLKVLKAVREWSTTPVIVLTVRDSETEKISLLDAGANDYVTKPFSVAELLARVRAALRTVQQDDAESVFMNGKLAIDFAAHVVKLDGAEIKLTDTEYRLLSLLAKNAGKLMTQRQLLKEIWGMSAIERTHYLRIYVAQLRHKLEDDPARPQMIVTEPGVGYRMVNMRP